MTQQQQTRPEEKFCTKGPPAADVNECAEIVGAEYKHWVDSPEQLATIAIGATGAAANILCAINGFRAPWHPKPGERPVGQLAKPHQPDRDFTLEGVNRKPQPDNEDAHVILRALAANDPDLIGIGDMAEEIVQALNIETTQRGTGWHDIELPRIVEEIAKRYLQPLQNELESRRVDGNRLQRMVEAINAALPGFKCAMGSECDHAEIALAELIAQHSHMNAGQFPLPMVGRKSGPADRSRKDPTQKTAEAGQQC